MDVFGLVFTLLFALSIMLFQTLARRKNARPVFLREVEAFTSLPNTVGQAVETGRRLHISLGTATLGEAHTAATLAGLTTLDQVSAAAVVSDKPPVVTTADGPTALLAEDVLHNVYKRQNAMAQFDPSAARVVGTDPLAFGAALTSQIKDEMVAGTILVGSVGSEAVLLTEAGHRAGVTTLAGSDDPATQALLFAGANHPLIGEDLYSGGAYIAGGLSAHKASLRSQDLARLIIGAVILIGSVLATIGIRF